MLQLVKVWVSRAFSPKYLLYTNVATGTSLLTLGDLLHQHSQAVAEGKPISTDWARTMRVALVGLCLSPMNHFYYHWLDRLIIHGRRGQIVAKKLVVDTATAPFFAASYVVGLNALEGKNLSQGFDEYRRKCLHFMALDAFLWMPVQAINFWFLPPSYRVLFVSCAALLDSFLYALIKQNQNIGVKVTEVEKTALCQ